MPSPCRFLGLDVRLAGNAQRVSPIRIQAAMITLKGSRACCVAEGFVGVEDLIEREAVGDQEHGIDLSRPHGLEQHRRDDRIHTSRGEGDRSVRSDADQA